MANASCPTHGPGDAWCGDRPALACEFERLPTGVPEAWPALLQAYTYICPDRPLLDELISFGPIVELGAGSGYWARLLRDLGGEVAAYDNWSWPQPENRWTEVLDGDERVLAEHANGTLLIVKPPRPNGTGPMIRAWAGRRLVVVTDGAFPNPKMGGEGELDAINALAAGRWQPAGARELYDPIIPWFVGAHFFTR